LDEIAMTCRAYKIIQRPDRERHRSRHPRSLPLVRQVPGAHQRQYEYQARQDHFLIGPSGCGKTTLLRCFNRVNERWDYVHTSGLIQIHGKNIYDPDVSLIELRKNVGMVFQRRTRCRFPSTKMLFSAFVCIATKMRLGARCSMKTWKRRSQR
jgi:ABC-type molybdenum transport system ATPase subunit/photorepair protein PhrA